MKPTRKTKSETPSTGRGTSAAVRKQTATSVQSSKKKKVAATDVAATDVAATDVAATDVAATDVERSSSLVAKGVSPSATTPRAPKKPITKTPPHPIGEAINRCISRISDIRYSLKHVMSYVAKSRLDDIESARKDLHNQLTSLVANAGDGASRALAIKTIIEATSRLVRLEQSELLAILSTGHFLTLFSSFDAFTGELLTAIYRKKPDLYSKLNRSMMVAEMLQYSNVEDIKDIVLKSEIETVRRKSYVEQFELLESQFGLPLTKFDGWPAFVECAQRRNLFTHCDGYVSDQYISICRKHGCALSEDVREGVRLQLEPQYLARACSLTIEVALKLGQTLWRKVFPGELEEADKHLKNAQYDFLRRDEWVSARIAGDFALSLPKHSTSVLKTLMAVNYVIALRRCELEDKAKTVLDSIDWTALCYDFRLAERVLRHDFQNANELMIKIGKCGEFVDEHSYHSWPLFWEFRQTEEFAGAYKAVYGYDFADKLRSSASDSERRTTREIKQQEETCARLLSATIPDDDECCPQQAPCDGLMAAPEE